MEGLAILRGDEKLEEILAMPAGQLISLITRHYIYHNANSELGTAFSRDGIWNCTNRKRRG